MFGKVEICGINTSKLPVLSEEEKNELLSKAKSGDEKAREKLINGNLRLVLSMIQKFVSRSEDPDDIFQVGCIGLIKAIDNFDTDQNVKFSTYAVPMIIGEIRRYMRDNSMIRVSRSLRSLAYKALGEKERLSSLLGREPTADEITEAVNGRIASSGDAGAKKVTSSEISEALDAVLTPASLYDPVFSDSGDSIYLMDQISDDSSGVESWTESIALSQAISSLTKREHDIINMRFYMGKTQVEIASEIGISQAQISRLEKSAVSKIRKML